MPLLLSILGFFKDWKFIFIPLVVISLLGGIYIWGRADGKMSYKVKCTANLEALRAAAQRDHDSLQGLVDRTSTEFEAWKASHAETDNEVDKNYDTAIKTKTITACPATADFVRIYGRATGDNTGAESKAGR